LDSEFLRQIEEMERRSSQSKCKYFIHMENDLSELSSCPHGFTMIMIILDCLLQNAMIAMYFTYYYVE
jgi:hypothetical protein